MVEAARHWLPAELYSLVARNLATGDLYALSLASRLTDAAATPFLYQRIEFQPSARVEAALSLLNSLINCPDLAKLVKHLVLAWTGTSDRTADVATRLKTSLPRLVNLQHLTISRSLNAFTWIFEDATLPALRHFHCFARDEISLSFLVRHPDLQTLTIRLPQGAHGIRHWGLKVEEIRFWDGNARDLLRLSEDGELRPALRRVAWTGIATPAELSTLAAQFPNVEQINHLVVAAYYHRPVLEAQWPSIRRLGVVADPEVLHRECDCLFRFARRAVDRLPNLQTLDILFRDVILLQEELSTIDAAVQLISAVHEIRLITAAGQAYIRDLGESRFISVPLQDEHNAPVIPWGLMLSRK